MTVLFVLVVLVPTLIAWGLGARWALRWLRAWWAARGRGPVGECVCGKEVRGRQLHVVAAVSTDDQALGIDGMTAMSADFCSEHCPGGCLRGCVPSTT